MAIKIVERKHKICSYNDIIRERLGGTFGITVHHSDGTETKSRCKNLMVDVGLQHLGDILAGVETTDIDLGFIEPGESTAVTTPGMTDTQDELEGTPTARFAATAQTRNASSPFEVSIEAFIASGDYDRPQTITEMCVFFTPVGGDMFARGILDTPIALTGSDTATINYSITFK